MKKYKIIYADPPWEYDKKIGQGIVNEQYETMTIEEISELNVDNISDNDSVLFIWITPPLLDRVFQVISSWGFVYKTIGFNWIKLNKNGTPFFGIGHYTKSNSELCLLCIKGNGLEVKDNTVSQIVLSKKNKHSIKPDEIRHKIVKMYGNLPRIELFARQRYEGWDCYGNQLSKDVQMVLK